MTGVQTCALPISGCSECNKSGYKGRSGLYELFMLDEKIKELVVKRASLSVIRNTARENGMKTLREDAMEKYKDGVTTMEEVMRVTSEE